MTSRKRVTSHEREMYMSMSMSMAADALLCCCVCCVVLCCVCCVTCVCSTIHLNRASDLAGAGVAGMDVTADTHTGQEAHNRDRDRREDRRRMLKGREKKERKSLHMEHGASGQEEKHGMQMRTHVRNIFIHL